MYFTFLRDPLRIDTSNNASERALRPAVSWRKLSFGSRDEHGRLFVQRTLTVVSTLKKQKRSCFAFIKQALLARLHNG
ncbi:MAG: transposase [Myxococcales bacterium]|nr:MAG: transposase [Myxococcales bacterium]